MPAQPQDRPFVSVNFAVTWDGRISTRNRTPSDFSSKRDKHRLLEIRSIGDAVLASVTTISADRMTMGLPDEALRSARAQRGQAKYPLRVLLTNSGRIDPSLPVFEKTFSPIAIFSTHRMPQDVQEALRGKAKLHLTGENSVSLREMMHTLRQEYAVRQLVCEGGGQVFRSFLAEDLVDEIYLTLCPCIFGGVDAPTLTGLAGDYLPHSIKCELLSVETIEGECFLRYAVKREG
ncbi:RibD family protein [Verrucomicrobiota bacterium sgz303538]